MSLGLGDDEECEALQAALAFIDEYGNDLFSDEYGNDLFSDESSSSSRESHTTKHNSNNVTRHSKQINRNSRNTAGTTSLPRPRTKQQLPRRNRSRDRQRLEILQLRTEAQVLQNRIADMKRKQQVADAEDAIVDVMNPTFDQDNGLLFGVWKDLAKKYRRLRKESEAENQHLCGVYTHQVATIETLRRLLQTQEQVKRTLRFPKSYCGQSASMASHPFDSLARDAPMPPSLEPGPQLVRCSVGGPPALFPVRFERAVCSDLVVRLVEVFSKFYYLGRYCLPVSVPARVVCSAMH
ncbi:hypothetical protein F444_13052 [Phytophthora nicotianae P1976]|uniref:Uncharacterized protein n=1 Tax=Phytophthora nicotianae P1976 TaxID=1317066 RepID=A0A080ZV04_PHYNI|nr:hypothetical protein F444_13052 [Phytophthora nicotianae P1976]